MAETVPKQVKEVEFDADTQLAALFGDLAHPAHDTKEH